MAVVVSDSPISRLEIDVAGQEQDDAHGEAEDQRHEPTDDPAVQRIAGQLGEVDLVAGHEEQEADPEGRTVR